jgi:hypothetical protein
VEGSGSVLSGLWKEVTIKVNAVDHNWEALTALQMTVRTNARLFFIRVCALTHTTIM